MIYDFAFSKVLLFTLFAVESVNEEDDDFMEKLDIAISRSESPPAKRRCSEEITATNSSESVTENGTEKIALPLSKDSIDVEKSEDSHLTNILSKPAEEITDSDAEKIENDLLKDLDDDHNNDLDSVCEEVQDLVDSILESDDNQKESTESSEKEVQNQSTATVNDESKEKEEDNPATTPDAAPEKAIKSIDSVFDDLFTEETNKVQEKKPDVDSVTQDDVSPQDDKADKTADEIECVILPKENDVLAPPTDPSTNLKIELDEETEQELKAEDLLVACESPDDTRRVEDLNQQENSSEASSSAGDAPEDSSDCDKQTAEDTSNDEVKNHNDQPEIEQQKPPPNETAPESGKSDQMEVDDDPTADEPTTPIEFATADEKHVCIVLEKETQDEPESVVSESALESVTPELPLEFIPLKLKFMRKFSSAAGKLSRPELEELLIEKITESLMFCSDNTDLRARLEKQEKISEAFKKRLDNVKKQYNDLEMIHNRVMKDLKERPNAAITPVKITRAVGLQVYQPVPRSKLAPPTVTTQSLMKTSNKRQLESELAVNGKGLSPENAKRKKTLKITPLRPPLSDKERASVDRQEAKEEQKLRSNVSMNIMGVASPVAIPSSVTMTPVSAMNGSKKTTETMQSSASIDLTDDIEEGNSNSVNSKVATSPFQQPPALVAIRGTNQSNVSQPSRNAFIIKPTIVSANIRKCKISRDKYSKYF